MCSVYFDLRLPPSDSLVFCPPVSECGPSMNLFLSCHGAAPLHAFVCPGAQSVPMMYLVFHGPPLNASLLFPSS